MEAHTFLLQLLVILVAARVCGEIYTAMVMVIAYTTLLSPFWIKLYYRRVMPLLEGEVRATG